MTPADSQQIRLTRRARVRKIRRRVVAGALALFVATWLLITVTLVTGHDPALARQRSTKSTPTTATTTTNGSGNGATTTASSGSSTAATTTTGSTQSSTGSSQSTTSSPSSVTSGQS